jgi:hypothetical protein
MNVVTFVEGLGIGKILLSGFGIIIVASLFVLLILYRKNYSADKIAKFWLCVLKIIFHYKEEPNDRKTD